MASFIDLAATCAPHVHAQTLAAVVKTESVFKPYIISIDRKGKNAGSKNFSSLDAAVAEAIKLVNSGEHIGVGLGQITDPNIRRMGLTWKEAFEPCSNLRASAKILQDNYVRAKPEVVGEQQALKMALSAYNTGSQSRGITNGYVSKVVKNAAVVDVPAINVGTEPVPESNQYHVLESGEVDHVLEAVGETEGPKKDPFSFEKAKPFSF